MKKLTKRKGNYVWWNGNQDFSMRDRYAKVLDRLAAYEDTGLTPEEVHRLKAKYEALESDKNAIQSSLINTEMNLEAQQQEIDRLKDRNVTYVNENANQAKEIERLNEVLDDWKHNAKCDADHIAGLIADKDEQAGRIMQMEDGLKRLRISLQWLFETIGSFSYKERAKEKIAAIDAMLGGKEDANS